MAPRPIATAIQGKPLTIYGEGSQTRSFCYVDDLIDGLVRLMRSDYSVTGPINLGNPVEFSVRELAEQLLGKLRSNAGLVSEPLPADDPRQRKPDITKAQQVLGWEPKVPLSEGLDHTIAYFKQLLSEPGNVAASVVE